MEPYLHLAPRRTSEPPIFSPMFEPHTKSNWSSLKGIKVYKRIRLKEKSILKAEWDRAEDNLPNCPKCYEPNPDYQSKGWVRRDELIKDRPVGNRPLLIDIKCRKYQCQDCEKTFGSRHPDMRKSSNLTDALVSHITECAMGKETHASIAERTGIHESTVRKYFRKRVQSLEKGTPNRHSPKALGIDGVDVGNAPPDAGDTKKDGPSINVVSLNDEGGSVIGFLPDQDSGRLKDFLDDKINPSGEVLPVVIDMDKSFRKAIRESSLPTAIVIDRYHVSRRANLALRDAKSALLNTSTLRRDWRSIKRALENGRSTGEIDIGARQMTIVDELESENEPSAKEKLRLVELVYKERLRFQRIMICDDYSREEAIDRYRNWTRSLNPKIRKFFRSRVISTVDNWHDEVMNFFDFPYTNGPVEGANTRAKELKRKSRGLRNKTAEVKMRSNESFGASIPPWEV